MQARGVESAIHEATVPQVVLLAPVSPDRAALEACLRSSGYSVEPVPAGLSATRHAIARTDPVAVLVDLEPLRHRPASIEILVQSAKPAPVLLVLPADNQHAVVPALAVGAHGAVCASRPLEAVRALDLALRGEVVIPRSMLSPIVHELRSYAALATATGPLAKLTPREREVLRLLNAGSSTTQIARSLVVQPVTVRTHVAGIIRKLGVPDRQGAIDLLEKQAAVSKR